MTDFGHVKCRYCGKECWGTYGDWPDLLPEDVEEALQEAGEARLCGCLGAKRVKELNIRSEEKYRHYKQYLFWWLNHCYYENEQPNKNGYYMETNPRWDYASPKVVTKII